MPANPSTTQEMPRSRLVTPFSTSLDHLLAELGRIDLLIQAQVHEARRTATADADFQGLCITEKEVDALLARPCGLPHWAQTASPAATRDIHKALVKQKTVIEERKQASRAAGIILRLEELARTFRLDPWSIDILLVCLAPEFDLRYEKLYAYLQDDVTRKRPSVDLILNLLSRHYGEKLAARRWFAPGSPLLEFQLLELFVDPSQPEPPLLRKYCRLDPRIVGFLLGQDTLDDRLRRVVNLWKPGEDIERSPWAKLIQEQFEQFVSQARKEKAKVVLYLQAPAATGKRQAAQALCRALDAGMVEADLRRLLQRAEPDFSTSVQLVLRESWLRRAVIYWKGFDALLAPEKTEEREFFLGQIKHSLGMTFLAGEAAWEPGEGELVGMRFARVEFPELDHAQRRALWERLLSADTPMLNEVSSKFRLSLGRIVAAAATAQNLARRRSPENPAVSRDDLHLACRLHSNRKLGTLARRIDPKYTLADIVLPPDPFAQLHEILGQARQRELVYGEWGFDRKHAYGKGLNALFSGPPGTGKTMAAQVLANELGLDLYQIDLSQVVSKYIGETEKNLNEIFREAGGSNAILFFDEADALFGKRSETKDAHDRYANIEVGYLLQKMEEYDGIAILATNLRNNLDDAFLRRLHVIIDFPFPDEEYRRRLWELAFPRETPVGPDVDFRVLARTIRLAGGNIKNIALTAAFYAANNGLVITMPHLMLAARREHVKLGRNWAEFDPRPALGEPSST